MFQYFIFPPTIIICSLPMPTHNPFVLRQNDLSDSYLWRMYVSLRHYPHKQYAAINFAT